MGTGVRKEVFAEADYTRFRERLEWCLGALAGLLERPGFGVGPTTLGAELELCLIDGDARPLCGNQAIREAVADPRVNLEVDRFNLELNATPVLLAGQPFAALGAELEGLLGRVGAAAASQAGGRLALVGILPTLRRGDLQLDAISDAARYRALNHGLRRLRHDPFRIRISSADPLDLTADDVTTEGAATSFQLHLRVDPGEFTRAYNAAQAASAPVLAVAGNSPTFLGHRLWEETRIALCKQSVDDRSGGEPRRRVARMGLGTGWLRGGPLAAFAESVRLYEPVLPVLSDHPQSGDHSPGPGPGLEELRLHQSTVWRWNRAIYDPAGGGHLRIELRALPAGPTVADMLASAAFLVGLTRWLAGQDEDEGWTRVLAFERADHGFYRAAQHGLAARLDWPFTPSGQPAPRTRTLRAAALVLELLPAAWEGLVSGGVASAQADQLLELIAGRARTGQTGAVWQRRTLAALEPRLGRERALAAMLERYLEHAATGQPVHTWPA